jgi:hypothetical protein
LSQILDFDFDALSVLVGQPMGVDYNFGLVTLTREPKGYEQVPALNMPWLLQTDGQGDSIFAPSSAVSDSADLVYLGYVKPDPLRFPDKPCPVIRRGVMADVFQILDIAEHRQVWSIFIITETVNFHRPTIGS